MNPHDPTGEPMSNENKLPRDYFFGADDAMTEYLTAQGKAAMAEQLEAYQILRERAYKMLVLFLAGASGSIGLFFNMGCLSDLRRSLVMLLFSAGWSVSSLMIVFGCLISKARTTIESSPGILYFSYEDGTKVSLSDLKRIRLHDYTEGCREILSTCKGMSSWFNWAAGIACATPAVLVLAALILFFIFQA